MKLSDIKDKLPERFYSVLCGSGIDELRPAQDKAITAGLFDRKSLLVCTPTSSGKTLIAEFAMLKAILEGKGKAVYIVPLKALASEKLKEFKRRYDSVIRIALSVGDVDSSDSYLADYDLIIVTSEKLDSLIRHRAEWVRMISVVVVDEIHLLNDPDRGPTLEVLITMLKEMLPKAQLVALSATIGNPEELASWLGANLVLDSWRPVPLHRGIYHAGKIEFRKKE